MISSTLINPGFVIAFEKYGDITLSDFDSLTWQQKMNNSYNYLFTSEKGKKIQEQFKIWKIWQTENKNVLPEKLIEEIESLFDEFFVHKSSL